MLPLADLDLATFEKVGRRADAWTLVRANATIDLADATSIGERLDKLSTERQTRQAQLEDHYRREHRRLHGVVSA